ncbi:MAG: CRISPR-associated endonuclease Cas2 [Candidatus Blackburnbacteria bacterium]|nr:CRISPR-associated endonuclease Cas2 [Candidatus Blackburnbacteria bacterium]
MRKKLIKLSPTTKKVLLLVGIGAFIAGTLVLPGLPRILQGKRFNFDGFLEEDEWEEFDERRLRQKLKALHDAKLVKIYQSGEQYTIQLTKKGKRHLLRYKITELSIPQPKEWDRKWRIVAYDVPKENTRARDALRHMLRKLGFYQLQKSVYLYPYPCEDAIEFLREVYGVGEHVTLLTVGYLENEEAYRDYFNI